MNLVIIGGGLAGISLAYFLQDSPAISHIEILEKESAAGGLCRSFSDAGLVYDVGPHIFFSKDKAMLGFLLSTLGDNKARLRRSNRVICNGKWLQYPFENDLSKLAPADLEYCVSTFMDNPYEEYEPQNMLQFLLKTFGEGIVNLYLRPYNEKIWKFDPSFMDLKMVERIPKPPKEDILRSAEGETVDGYLHQLYFNYPVQGGIAALIESLTAKLNGKVAIRLNCDVTRILRKGDKHVAGCANGARFEADMVVSTMPLPLLPQICGTSQNTALAAAKNLRHNSTILAIVTVKNDYAGDNFVFTIPDSDVVFHRLTRQNFFGTNYAPNSGAAYMAEIAIHKNSRHGEPQDDEIAKQVAGGLKKLGFIRNYSEILGSFVRRFEHTYVVCDLNHARNTSVLREWAAHEGIILHGRFGRFEYWNMDTVVKQSMLLSDKIKENIQ
jgi:protoporphyrinogen oxidase